MRTIKKTNSSYDEFVLLRQLLLDTVPFAIVNDIYDAKNKTCYFSFWDSDYIPKEWEEWIIRPKK